MIEKKNTPMTNEDQVFNNAMVWNNVVHKYFQSYLVNCRARINTY